MCGCDIEFAPHRVGIVAEYGLRATGHAARAHREHQILRIHADIAYFGTPHQSGMMKRPRAAHRKIRGCAKTPGAYRHLSSRVTPSAWYSINADIELAFAVYAFVFWRRKENRAIVTLPYGLVKEDTAQPIAHFTRNDVAVPGLRVAVGGRKMRRIENRSSVSVPPADGRKPRIDRRCARADRRFESVGDLSVVSITTGHSSSGQG